MTILTVDYYQEVTGDTTTAHATVRSNLLRAQGLVQDYLGRYLELGTYTQRLPVWPTGVAYPAAVPIASVAASSQAEILDDATLFNVVPDDEQVDFPHTWPGQILPWPDETVWGRGGATGYEPQYVFATVTYVGGWDIDTLPPSLAISIAKLAQALRPGSDESRIPPGATLVRVGDVQINRPREAVEGFLNQILPGLTGSIKGYTLDRL